MTRSLPPAFAFAASDAVFLDFDGTLAPLQDDPDSVSMPRQIHDALEELSQSLSGALAIISGRDLSDLSLRVPQSLLRIGNHGLYQAEAFEAANPARTAPDGALVAALDTLVADNPGSRIEVKGRVLAIHYRAAPHCGSALLQGMADALKAFPDYRYQSGKCVLEAKPAAANKGYALTERMRAAPFKGRRPIMVGDDTTDEDAFKAAQALGGIGIKVGEGESLAQFRANTIDEIHTVIRKGMS